MMKHIQLDILATPVQQEELIALLDDFNPTGFEQTDELLKAYFPTEGFAAEGVGQILAGYHYQQKEVEEQNWNAVWEQNFHPVVVGSFCAVRAHFHQPVTGVQHEIVITPKMSFGTGHHATTYMMMQQMQNLNLQDKFVFDFGTGTGILSILAEKLGAAAVTAIDVDEWSLENTLENAERNGCRKISVTLSSQLPAETFDIVLANINRNVILEYMEALVAITRPDGKLLFSGLLTSDKDAVAGEANRNGLRLKTALEKQGWVSLCFVNQP